MWTCLFHYADVNLFFFVIINEFGSKYLYPRLVGQSIGLHDVLVIFLLFAGLEVGGVVGVLFAAPLTAIAVAIVVHLYRFWQDLPDSLIFDPKHRDNRYIQAEKGTLGPVENSANTNYGFA